MQNNNLPGRSIQLINGPWDKREIEDLGQVVIRMVIAEQYEKDGKTPVKGVRIGSAIYEPSEDRTLAFWLENSWDGIFAGRSKP
jgi:hypothetical protein